MQYITNDFLQVYRLFWIKFELIMTEVKNDYES